jgi:putative tryptophan/tyrosine transport system substrate-binding protein
MARRATGLVVTLVILASLPAAEAQSPARVARIGYLQLVPGERNREAFLQGLRDHGWVEGQNVLIEYRDAAGDYDRLARLAGKLVQLKVDVIVAGGGVDGAQAAQKATRTIPIVFPVAMDPVGYRLVASLARP